MALNATFRVSRVTCAATVAVSLSQRFGSDSRPITNMKNDYLCQETNMSHQRLPEVQEWSEQVAMNRNGCIDLGGLRPLNRGTNN